MIQLATSTANAIAPTLRCSEKKNTKRGNSPKWPEYKWQVESGLALGKSERRFFTYETTAMVAPAAITASMALPPSRNTESPASAER